MKVRSVGAESQAGDTARRAALPDGSHGDGLFQRGVDQQFEPNKTTLLGRKSDCFPNP